MRNNSLGYNRTGLPQLPVTVAGENHNNPSSAGKFPAESWGLLYDVKAIVFHRYTSIAELCFGTPWMQSLQITVLLLRRQSRRQLSQLQNDNEFPQVTLTLIPTSKLA